MEHILENRQKTLDFLAEEQEKRDRANQEEYGIYAYHVYDRAKGYNDINKIRKVVELET